MKWLMVLLLASPAAAQERADVPYSWARHKPGTFLKTRMTSSGTAIVEYHRTLKEITDKEAIFDLVTVSIPTKERKASVQKLFLIQPGGENIAEETLKLKDREYKCRVLKANYEQGGVKMDSKFWTAEGVDFPLKTLEVGTGAERWMNFESGALLVSLDEELVVAGRKLKCAKYAGTVKGEQSGTLAFWLCPEVPGGMVRSETELGAPDAKSKMKMVIETIEFEVKK